MKFEGKFINEKGEEINRWGEFSGKEDFDEYFKKRGWRVVECWEINVEGPSFLREDSRKDLRDYQKHVRILQSGKIKCPFCKTENLFPDNASEVSRTCGQCKKALESSPTIHRKPSPALNERDVFQKTKRRGRMVVFSIVWTVLLFVILLIVDNMLANQIPIGSQYGTYLFQGQVLANGFGQRGINQREDARIIVLSIITIIIWMTPFLILLWWKSSKKKKSLTAIVKLSCPSCSTVNMFPEVKDKSHEAFTCGKCRKLFGGTSTSS